MSLSDEEKSDEEQMEEWYADRTSYAALAHWIGGGLVLVTVWLINFFSWYLHGIDRVNSLFVCGMMMMSALYVYRGAVWRGRVWLGPFVVLFTEAASAAIVFGKWLFGFEQTHIRAPLIFVALAILCGLYAVLEWRGLRKGVED